MAVSKSQINRISDFDLRTVLLGMYDQVDANNQANGIQWLTPVNQVQPASTAPPPAPSITVSGANGAFTYEITPVSQSINKAVFYEISYSAQSNFTSGVTTLPVSGATSGNVAAPGITAFFRVRASYDQNNWSSYSSAGAAISAGLQSSKATENNLPLNQTNYANIDSVDPSGTANVRVYGSAGIGTQYASVKGEDETILPSATIIGVPYGSSRVVAFDGTNYQLKGTLPEVFADDLTPTGAVSVVESGTVTLPEVSLILSATDGHVIGWNVTNQGNGLTSDVTLVIVTGTGSGATPGAQTISAGKLISIAPGNPGAGYLSGDTVTVSGGTFAGSTGGGTNIGGNGGRFVYNDGTLGAGA